MTQLSEKTLILHNIRSTHNVGSIFRTADAAGITKIFLSGYTPAPIDRFGRKRNDVAKSALGAEESVSWEQIESTTELLSELKKQNFKTIALEQSEQSIDYKEIKIKDGENVAIVLGEEVNGIEKEVLEAVDIIAEIPMLGEKESLNVSVATGVFLFRLFKI